MGRASPVRAALKQQPSVKSSFTTHRHHCYQEAEDLPIELCVSPDAGRSCWVFHLRCDRLRHPRRIELLIHINRRGDLEGAVQLSDDLIVCNASGLPVNQYRVRDGKLDFRVFRDNEIGAWRTLTTEDVLMHLVLKTQVATWLYARRGLTDGSALKKAA